MNPLILNFRGNALSQLGRYDEAASRLTHMAVVDDA